MAFVRAKKKYLLSAICHKIKCWCLKDDMEGSGGGFINRGVGVSGPEGRQVSSVYRRNTPGPLDGDIHFFIFLLSV